MSLLHRAFVVWTLAALGAVIGILLVTPHADAACGAMPYTFTNNVSIIDATTTNANNTFLQNCAQNVDNSQIGSAGIFASQIKCSTVATCSFGGSLEYTFPSTLAVTFSSVVTHVAPYVTDTGASVGATLHGVLITGSVSNWTCTSPPCNIATVTLSAAAAFTSGSTYSCIGNIQGPVVSANPVSGTSVTLYQEGGTTSVSGTYHYAVSCVGT